MSSGSPSDGECRIDCCPSAILTSLARRESGRGDEIAMREAKQQIHLARHGETEWSLSGQHTGLTDLPLIESGERAARDLAERLRGRSFAQVFTSPLRRAVQTCALAGFAAQADERSRSRGVELRRLRGPHHRSDPRRATGVAALPRRLSQRRVAGAGRRARGPGGAAHPGRARRRAALFERSHPARARRALARTRRERAAGFWCWGRRASPCSVMNTTRRSR